MFTLSLQIKLFYISFFIGVIVAFFFQVHDNFCLDFKIKGAWLVILDVFFWILAAIFTFSFLQVTVYGLIRLFVFIGFTCGWYVFNKGKNYFIFLNKTATTIKM